jgi:hypothetical protein
LILNKSVLFQVESEVSYSDLVKKNGDYHDMNHANYKKWLQRKLIPSLESRSVIVVDNVSYHNRHPTSNARKGEMLFWLDKHGIRYSSDMKKAELCDLIKMHKQQYETFAIDYMLGGHGHTVPLLL